MGVDGLLGWPGIASACAGSPSVQARDAAALFAAPPAAGVVLYMLLAGSPPFFDASEPRLLRSIMQANYDFDTQAWDPVRHRGGSRLWLLLAYATLMLS